MYKDWIKISQIISSESDLELLKFVSATNIVRQELKKRKIQQLGIEKYEKSIYKKLCDG